MTKFCKIHWLMLLMAVLLIGAQCRTGYNCRGPLRDPQTVKKLSKGILEFALNIYKALSFEGNVFLSPFSIAMALAMTSTGARGRTLRQMRYALRLQRLNNRDISHAFASVLNSICSNPNYTLSTANRIYVQDDVPIKRSFMHNLAYNFKSSAESVDFANNADEAISEINRWVEQQTENNIKNLFARGSLGSDTTMVLVNAIYFKGSWNQQFDKQNTRLDYFNQADGKSVSVPMMNAKETFKYATSTALKSKMLQMEYAGNRLVMYLILPDRPSGLVRMRKHLTAEIFNFMRDELGFNEVTVKIPKFKLNCKTDLNGVLSWMNMKDLFSRNNADLSGIANVRGMDDNLYVSKVVHQASVTVDERGTTASVATGIAFAPASAVPRRIEFIADHPFTFIIYDTLTELILFVGNVDTLPT